MADPFFESALNAGSILTGFCGTFLVFRIEREAGFYRQPGYDERSKPMVICYNAQHFTSSLFLLSLASVCSAVFGVVIPLFALAGWPFASQQKAQVLGGLLAAVILSAGYFLNELFHYRILLKHVAAGLSQRVKGLNVAVFVGCAVWCWWWVAKH